MDKRLRNILFVLVMGVFLFLVLDLFLSGRYNGNVILDDNSRMILDSNAGYIGDMIKLNRGMENDLLFNFRNSEENDLMSCIVKIEGSDSESFIGDVHFGRNVDYNVKISVPQDFLSNEDIMKVLVNCNDFSKTYDIPFKVVTPDFGLILKEDFREVNNLILQYEIRDYDNSERSLILNYKIIDINSKVVSQGTEVVYVEGDREYNLSVPFDKNVYGEFRIYLNAKDKDNEINYSNRISLPYKSITGYAIKEKVGTLSYMVIALALIVLFFVGVRYASRSARLKEMNERKNYIKLDLK